MKAVTFFILLAALGIAAAAQPAFPISYYGHIFQDGANASNGTIVEVFVNGSVIENTTTPSNGECDQNEYLLTNILAPEGTEYVIYANGVEILRKNWTAEDSGAQIELNVSFNSTPNGGGCTYDSGCASGKCCSGVCKDSCGSNINYLGGGGGGGGGIAIQEEEEVVEPAPQQDGTYFGDFRSTQDTEEENQPPTFGEGRETAPTPVQAPPAEEEGLTPAATGLFRIGNMNVTWPKLIVGVLFIAALVGGGYYGYKGGKGKGKGNRKKKK